MQASMQSARAALPTRVMRSDESSEDEEAVTDLPFLPDQEKQEAQLLDGPSRPSCFQKHRRMWISALAAGATGIILWASRAPGQASDSRVPDDVSSYVALVGDSCSAEGGACLDNHCCKDAGFHCYEKNAQWAACLSGCTPGIHADDPPEYQIPWLCTELSTGSPAPAPPATSPPAAPLAPAPPVVPVAVAPATPSPTAPAPQGHPTASASSSMPSMFCFMVLGPGSTQDAELAEFQYSRKQGVFACGDWAVYVGPSEKAQLSSEPYLMATQLHSTLIVGADYTWRRHLAAWEDVYASGKALEHDFVIKVSPHSVFLPERMGHVTSKIQPGKETFYVRTTSHAFGDMDGMTSSLEVLSSGALEWYGQKRFRSVGRCMVELPYKDLNEDLFMQECLDLLGVDHVDMFNVDVVGKPEHCNNPLPPVFGPFENPTKDDFNKCMLATTNR